jgi:hypothetical protein
VDRRGIGQLLLREARDAAMAGDAPADSAVGG